MPPKPPKSQARKGLGLVQRPELKQFTGQFTSGLIASNTWTVHNLADLIVQGNSASTRVGRTVRIVRARVSFAWTPNDGNDLLHCMVLDARTADMTTDAFTSTSTYNSFPITALARPVGEIVLGNFPCLTHASWISGDAFVKTWDVNLDMVVHYDDASDVIGRALMFGDNCNTSSTLGAGNVSLWFYDA